MLSSTVTYQYWMLTVTMQLSAVITQQCNASQPILPHKECKWEFAKSLPVYHQALTLSYTSNWIYFSISSLTFKVA
jgi:hypothetical protein